MCLYPRLVANPKYKPNKKNGGNVPECKDKRLLAVPIKCGKCIECREAIAREWKIRLNEELKSNPEAYFVTLTFSEESLIKLNEAATEKNEGIIADENETATIAIRYFLERWRKKHNKSVKHWLITELGHDNTERLHLHGIIFTDSDKIKDLEKIWQYGWIHIGEFCNETTIGYITKYVTKIDNDHKDFNGKIFCTAGIGSGYIKNGKNFNKYRKNETKEYYKNNAGYRMQLPIYYRNHIYKEEEREQLWIEKIEKQERYIRGVKYNIKTEKDRKDYMNALKTAQKDNIKNGYGSIEWKKDVYTKSMNKINNWDI